MEQEKLCGATIGPDPEKFWKELTDAEKIERLHIVVKDLMRQLDRVGRTAIKASDVSQKHQHAVDGTVLMPVLSNQCEAESIRRKDSEYF